jgi:hypothetical protein
LTRVRVKSACWTLSGLDAYREIVHACDERQ